MIFISAGHSPNAPLRRDPGAIGCNGVREGDLTIELRDLVCNYLDSKGVRYIKDLDTETLAQYLRRIQTGSGSVVLEFHFDAFNRVASGTTSLVESDADILDMSFGKELADATSSLLSIPNRGVRKENESHRGRLGLMQEEGVVCLLEVCFIDNCQDTASYQRNKQRLAQIYGDILIKYENKI